MGYVKNRWGLFVQTAALCPAQIICSHLQPKNAHLLSKAAPSSANSRYPIGFTGIVQGCKKYRPHISKEKGAQSIPPVQRSSSVPVWAKLLQKQRLLSSPVLLFKLILWNANVSHWVLILPRQHYRRMSAESIKKLRKYSFYYRVIFGIDPSGFPVASVLFYMPMDGALFQAVWMQEPISCNLILNGPQANWENKDRQGHHVDRCARGILELCSA